MLNQKLLFPLCLGASVATTTQTLQQLAGNMKSAAADIKKAHSGRPNGGDLCELHHAGSGFYRKL